MTQWPSGFESVQKLSRPLCSKAVLTQLRGSQADPNNPFWVIKAHPNVILDHNDISAPVLVNFLAQLYADIDRLKAEPQCRARGPRP